MDENAKFRSLNFSMRARFFRGFSIVPCTSKNDLAFFELASDRPSTSRLQFEV